MKQQKKILRTIALEEMLQRWRRSARGPRPRLSLTELFSSLYFLIQKGPLGRYELAELLHENQGVIRGLLERLQEKSLIETSKAGARATSKGRRVLASFLRKHRIASLERAEIHSMIPAGYCYASHLVGSGERAMKVIEQRDAAVRTGALGAMTILCVRGVLRAPPDNMDLNTVYPEAVKRLKTKFAPEDGDVILLAFASEEYPALAGALAATLAVNP